MKYNIREWPSDQTKMVKGITLSKKEVMKLNKSMKSNMTHKET